MMVNDIDKIEDIKNKINEYMQDPENVLTLKNKIIEELNKPYVKQLQCCCVWCKYNEPKNPDMGTITYCSKYEDTEENRCICEDREWLSLEI